MAVVARYCERFITLPTLDKGIHYTEMTIKSLPESYPGRQCIQNSLATLLMARFGRRGRTPESSNDIDACIEILETLLDHCTTDDPFEGVYWSNLGAAHSERHQTSNAPEDLDNAIYACERSITRKLPDAGGQLSHYLNNLSILYSDRYDKSNELADINLAIDTAERAVASLEPLPEALALPDDSTYLRYTIKNNLGHFYLERYHHAGAARDFHHALEAAKEAISAPEDHLNLGGFTANYSKILQETQADDAESQKKTIDDSIKAAKEAVALESKESPRWAGHERMVAGLYRKRYLLTSDVADMREATEANIRGYNCANASPWLRAWMAREAAELLYTLDADDVKQASNLLEHAVKLLPSVSPRSLRFGDQQNLISDFSGLGPDSAALILKNSNGTDAYKALRVLELGRGIIAGLLLEMRVDLSALQESADHKSLSGEIESLMEQLDSLTAEADQGVDEHASGGSALTWKRRKVVHDLETLLAQVRETPEFRSFLDMPAQEELIEAAGSGPLAIINVSKYGSNALLVEAPEGAPGRIWAIPLPGLTVAGIEGQIGKLRAYAESSTASRDMELLLEWLWDNLAGPVLNELGLRQTCCAETAKGWPHVYWIPCGRLVQLPIHAAGYHFDRSQRTVLDRAISTYSSSIKVMLYGRQRLLEHGKSEKQSAVVVGMEKTPGISKSHLRFVSEELKHVNRLLPKLGVEPHLASQRHDILTRLKNSCAIFHFAGHGLSDEEEPSRSALLLGRESLTVADLRNSRLQGSQPFLAYLSACSTSQSGNEKLVDEAIHLVSGCQLAGFRHTLGTLWEVYDECCPEVAQVVYENLVESGFTDKAVCFGLHRALRRLREQKVSTLPVKRNTSWAKKVKKEKTHGVIEEDLFMWAPYVHFGV